MTEFRWVLHDAQGDDLRVAGGFGDRHEAEAWMEREWPSLLDEGAETASLLEGDDVLYRMGLSATT